MEQKCPLWDAHYKETDFWEDVDQCNEELDNNDFFKLYCKHYDFRFYVHKDIYFESNADLKEKLLNLIVEHLVQSKICNENGGTKLWYFYFNDVNDGIYGRYPNYINLANQLKNYPIDTIEVACRSLVNCSLRYPHYGDIIALNTTEKRLVFEHEHNNSGNSGVMKLLEDFGYVKNTDNDGCYVITAQGWQKIDELHKQERIVNQGFIAMSFKEDTNFIREAFRTAIKESGYSVAIIDEKEHNNQIVPEIFYEIERSKFVVVDVTYPNYGAYYEAGYAQALGKPVIICCREDEFKSNTTRPHFDISQKSMIVWKDENDLIFRLKRRIEATVK